MAAQMSHESRELAEVYSAERVERARHFLQQRQEEVEHMKERVQAAYATCRELKHWMHRVEIEEDVARSQVARLREELFELMPCFDQQAADGPGANVKPFGHSNFAAE